MEIQDIIITPIYFFLIWVIARLIRARMPEGSLERKYFVPGLMLKLLGGIGVGMIYKFYYLQGDTLAYHQAGLLLNEFFWRSPLTYFNILFGDFEYFTAYFDVLPDSYGVNFLKGESTLAVSKLVSVFSLFCFGSYFSIALLFATLSYTGIWALYKTFSRIYPQLNREMAVACLFIPSAFFWGSGILKDSITIAAIGWLTYGIYHIFFLRKRILFSVLMMLFWVNLLALVKSYVLLAFLPPAMLWVVLGLFAGTTNPYRKTAFIGLLVAVMLIGGVRFSNQIVMKIQEEAVDTVLRTAIGSAKWNARGYTFNSNSSYQIDLDKVDLNNPLSIFSQLPHLVTLTLYRPFIWETNKVVILLSALENFIFLILSLRLIFSRRFYRLPRALLSDPNLIFFLIFTIGFSFAMGLSSGVFGALVRYKIPMLPFFVASLFILYHKTRNTKPNSRNSEP